MANKSSAQIWIEYTFARTVLGILRILPRKVAMSAGVAAGRLAYHLVGKLRRTGMRNLEIAFPEISVTKRSQILKAAFGNLGRVLASVSHFGELTVENMTDAVEYEPDPEFAAEYEKVVAAKRGRIILTGHLGNWELQAFSYPVFFGPLSFLARRMDNPRIEKMILDIRTRLGNMQVDKTNSATHILRTMRDGGSVGILADVNSHPKEGVFVPFFGVQACTASGIAMIAIRSNAVIVPMVVVWDEQKGKYVHVYENIIEPVITGDRKQDIVETTALCVAATESLIRRFPDQWIWVHRRWKTRPEGEPSLY